MGSPFTSAQTELPFTLDPHKTMPDVTLQSFMDAFLTSADVAGARTNLGLGGAATLNVGTTAGTVAAGDDVRFSAQTNLTVYVNGTTGNDSTGDGSTGAPYATFQKGVDEAISRGNSQLKVYSVYLAAGVYSTFTGTTRPYLNTLQIYGEGSKNTLVGDVTLTLSSGDPVKIISDHSVRFTNITIIGYTGTTGDTGSDGSPGADGTEELPDGGSGSDGSGGGTGGSGDPGLDLRVTGVTASGAISAPGAGGGQGGQGGNGGTGGNAYSGASGNGGGGGSGGTGGDGGPGGNGGNLYAYDTRCSSFSTVGGSGGAPGGGGSFGSGGSGLTPGSDGISGVGGMNSGATGSDGTLYLYYSSAASTVGALNGDYYQTSFDFAATMIA